MMIEITENRRPMASPGAGAAGRPRRRPPWPVVVLELLIAGSAVYGAVGLMTDTIGMPADWLHGTPFASWVIPGVLLLLVVAAPMSGAALLELRRSRWSTVASVTAGAAQICWIAAELLIMQRYNVLQPIMICLGLAVVLVVLWLRRDQPIAPATQRLGCRSAAVHLEPAQCTNAGDEGTDGADRQAHGQPQGH